jgi:ferredoxin
VAAPGCANRAGRGAPYPGRVRSASFRVRVDPDKCQGHNRCYSAAPELFELDELGMSAEIGTGLVPEELVGRARLAVDNCPEQAISLTRAEP